MTKKQLFKFLKRQIEVSRFEAHVRKDLLKRLNKLHRQVSGRIGEENLDEIGQRDLNRLIKDITELSSVAHKEIAKRVEAYSLELIESETAFVYSEMGAAWGVPKNKPSIGMPLILGVTAEEWLSKQASDYSHSIKMAVRNNDPIDHLPRQLANKNKAFTATWSRATSQHVIDVIGDKSKNTSGWWHVSVLDGKTSDICLVRSNKRWDSGKKPLGHNLPWKRPPLHPHCRSNVLPIVDVNKEPATMTVEDWLDDMSEAEQEEVLGVGKAKLYRDGKITLRDLLDQSGRPQSLRILQDKYLLLSLESDVDELLSIVKMREPKITELLQEIGDENNATLVGLDYKFKSKQSLIRKVESIARKRAQKASDAVGDINDALRYTYVLDEGSFFSDYQCIIASLEKHEQQVIKVSNTWRKGAMYKGINISLRKGQQVYELQFHTNESFALKNGKLHKLYEQFRDDAVSDATKAELRQQMIILSDNLATPENIGSIRSKRK